jgi:hypothetical protein
VDRIEIEDRIRSVARNTDTLIVKLDTLTERIDTARLNENQELVEYYERQFAEASVEFMDGVETILDDWYALNGVQRPPADREVLEDEMLDMIHSTVVGIVQNTPGAAPRSQDVPIPIQAPDAAPVRQAVTVSEDPAEMPPPPARRTKAGPRSKVDLTG